MSQATNLEPKFITRPVKKALKEKGVDLLALGEDAALMDEAMNSVLDMLYPNQTVDLDALPYGELQQLFHSCMEKTFPDQETVEK